MVMKASDNPAPEATGRPKHRAIGFFLVFMLVSGGAAFSLELIEFISTIAGGQADAILLIPVATYLIVTAGFGCLLVRSYLMGRFRDLEEPKYRILELEAKWDHPGQDSIPRPPV